MMPQAMHAATKATPYGKAMAIELRGVNKWFGSYHALKNINLSVTRGQRIVICGPSGSGKSTMIRCINHLEEHQSGDIIVNGKLVTEDLRKIDAVRSNVGMVFQHFNLFPHLTVLENCTLAPFWVRKMPRSAAEELARHYLDRVRIAEKAESYPRAVVGWPAATRCDCPGSLHEPKDHAFRRADLCPRSGDGQGGARHDGVACE